MGFSLSSPGVGGTVEGGEITWPLVIPDASNIEAGTTTGTKIGTAVGQKFGFFNAAPVVQQAGIVNADGTLADITTKFNTLISELEALGLIATV